MPRGPAVSLLVLPLPPPLSLAPDQVAISRVALLPQLELRRRDVFGRTVLHLAIVFNRPHVLKNLLKNTELDRYTLLMADRESGWNVAHYCVHLGHLTCLRYVVKKALLMGGGKKGPASMDVLDQLLRHKDHDGLAPLELLPCDWTDMMCFPTCVDKSGRLLLAPRRSAASTDPPVFHGIGAYRGGGDALLFGANKHFNLGFGDGDDRAHPCSLPRELFRLWSLPVRYHQLLVQSKHSVVVTDPRGGGPNVFCAGAASSGRLGNGSLMTLQMAFKAVKLGAAVDSVAAGDDHCVALAVDGTVYSWGSNLHRQLGYSTDEAFHSLLATAAADSAAGCCAVPQAVPLRPALYIGVAVLQVHSVAYSTSTIVSWGLNTGQMGVPIPHGTTVEAVGGLRGVAVPPQVLDFKHGEVAQVVATDRTMFVVTASSDIHVYTQFSHTRLVQFPHAQTDLDRTFDHFTPRVLHQRRGIARLVARSSRHAFALLSSGDVVGVALGTGSSLPRYTNVWRARERRRRVVDIDCSHDGGLIVGCQDGSVWTRAVGLAKFRLVPRANHAVRVACDPKFVSFAVVRDDLGALPHAVTPSTWTADVAAMAGMAGDTPEQLDTSVAEPLCVLDGVYPPLADGDVDSDLPRDQKPVRDDLFLEWYGTRWDAHCHRLPRRDVFYARAVPPALFFQEDSLLFDYRLEAVDGAASWSCGFHSAVMTARGCRWLAAGTPPPSRLNVRVDAAQRVISVECAAAAVSGFIYYLYTGAEIEHEGIAPHVSQLAELFGLTFSSGHVPAVLPAQLVDAYRALRKCLASTPGALRVQLEDGVVYVFGPLFAARSSYFRTLLDLRWQPKDAPLAACFPHVSKAQFAAVVSHVHGACPWEWDRSSKLLADHLLYVVLVAELADELMMDGLKEACALEIKDHITLSTVATLLEYAVELALPLLAALCLWYVYTNLGAWLGDPRFLAATTHDLVLLVERAVVSFRRLWLPLREREWIAVGSQTEGTRTEKDPLLCFLAHPREFDFALVENNHVFEFVPTLKVNVVRRPSKLLPIAPAVLDTPAPRVYLGAASRTVSFSDSAIEDEEGEFTLVLAQRRRRSSTRKSSGASAMPIPAPLLSQRRMSLTMSSPPALTPPATAPTGRAKLLAVMPKRSQRERMRQNSQHEAEPVSASRSGTPWATPKPTPLPVASGSFPALGQRTAAPWSEAAAAPVASSLAAVMLEETTKRERKAQAANTPSFADIVAEQKFNQWFEEELRRVQQMAAPEPTPQPAAGRRKPRGRSRG